MKVVRAGQAGPKNLDPCTGLIGAYTLSMISIDCGWCVRIRDHLYLVILRAKLSGAVYCYRSCLWVCNGRAI